VARTINSLTKLRRRYHRSIPLFDQIYTSLSQNPSATKPPSLPNKNLSSPHVLRTHRRHLIITIPTPHLPKKKRPSISVTLGDHILVSHARPMRTPFNDIISTGSRCWEGYNPSRTHFLKRRVGCPLHRLDSGVQGSDAGFPIAACAQG
jgi:hypothetical protein